MNFEKAELELITASQISYSKKIHQTFQHALFVLGNLYIKNKQLEKASIVLNYLGNQKILDRWVQQKTNDLKEKHKILFDQKVNEIPKLPWLVD